MIYASAVRNIIPGGVPMVRPALQVYFAFKIFRTAFSGVPRFVG